LDSPSILIIDDNKSLCDSLTESLSLRNYRVYTANDSASAFASLKSGHKDVILLDVRLDDEDGVSLIPKILEIDPSAPIIVITGFGTVETAVEAIKRGAFDYLQKPIKMEKLQKALENALHISQSPDSNIVSQSPAVAAILSHARKLAASNLPVLICGESGTGKELLAEFIHAHSPRASKTLHRVNSAAFSDSLLESELFGHEKGAFTGAVDRFPGVFERASGGTLFLDEIGEIDQNIQVKLLRVIQEKKFERVGGEETLEVDVRIVAATNKDLKALVEKGAFREDLYFRLNVVNINVPPLRERKDDIPLLMNAFLKEYAQENGKAVDGFDEKARAAIYGYLWPGNIRELRNCVESAVVMCKGRHHHRSGPAPHGAAVFRRGLYQHTRGGLPGRGAKTRRPWHAELPGRQQDKNRRSPQHWTQDPSPQAGRIRSGRKGKGL